MNQLQALKQVTTVVADTGDFRQLAQFQPQDATTNPSLILKAVQKPEYAPLLADTVARHRGQPLDEVVDRLLVRFGCEILSIIPGRVSTEVDARLSFDEDATYSRAERLIGLYQAAGVPTERVLIKIASTWEGIHAAERLDVAPHQFVPRGGIVPQRRPSIRVCCVVLRKRVSQVFHLRNLDAEQVL